MSDGIADAYRLRSALDGRGVKGTNCGRVCPRSVFGDIHHRYTFTDCKRHRVFRQLQQLVERPVFCKKPYGRRADESTGFDRNTNPLGDFDNWPDIVAVSASGAVRPNLQLLLGYLASH